MAGYFSVKGFDKFQHYKDRRPPWIKLYNDLLDDYEFCLLPDASKMHLIAIWLLASRYSNLVPADAEWISRRISATETVDLGVLVNSGFIVPDQDCSDMLASCKQVAPIETEGETETEEERKLPLAAKETAPIGAVLPPLPACLNRTKEVSNAKRGTRLEPTWQPTEQDREFATSRGLDSGHTAEQFRDHWHAKPGQAGVALDWKAKWRTWCRNEAKWTAERLASRPRSGGIVTGTLEDIAALEGEI